MSVFFSPYLPRVCIPAGIYVLPQPFVLSPIPIVGSLDTDCHGSSTQVLVKFVRLTEVSLQDASPSLNEVNFF